MTMIPLLLAAALSAGNAEFDATAASGAMDIALRREVRQLVEKGPSVGTLKAKMLADPSGYEKPDKARELAKGVYLDAMKSEFESVRKSVVERLGSAASSSVTIASDGELMRSFDARFAEERKAACDEQAKSIAANVKPSESDFGRKDEATIRTELEASVIGQQRAVVFEENRKYISDKIVEPIMASAKKELERQREYLKRTRCDSYSPSALTKELSDNLVRNVKEHRSKNPGETLSWGVFPVVVESGAKEIAEKRTLERVAHAIDDVEMKIDTESIRAKISSDREHHHKTSDSEQSFRNVFAGTLAGQAVEKVINDAPVAERVEFREFVMAHAGEASLGKAVEARVKRELLPRLREVREEIAAEDAKNVWPTLMDGTWFPEASLADDICSRSDYSRVVKKWRQSPELAKLAGAADGKMMLEETERIADARVSKAFELARTAINAQNAVLDKALPTVLGDARDRKNSWFSRTPDYAALVKMLTAEVESGWAETRETVLWGEDEKPGNAGLQHRELFPSVRRRIELVAKTVLVEMEKPEEVPEEKPEVPPEEIPPEELVLTISVKRSGDRMEAKILRGDSAVFEKDCPASGSDFRTMSGQLIDKLVEVLGL